MLGRSVGRARIAGVRAASARSFGAAAHVDREPKAEGAFGQMLEEEKRSLPFRHQAVNEPRGYPQTQLGKCALSPFAAPTKQPCRHQRLVEG